MAAEPVQRRRRRPSQSQPNEADGHTAKHHYGTKFYWQLASLLIVGLLFHLVYMLSIFDIYFRSPLVQGIEPIPPTAEAPAKRLVLFVGDGCRADKAFEYKPEDGFPRMPFIHRVCNKLGSFGISHTRVPTESRPGHIAMIAGFYEDVSAVTKGWKVNPVDYDHVLARAKHAWAFGAPEIVDLFSGPNVIGQHYSAEMIDFATNDAKALDKWSLDRLKELLEAASIDDELAGRLKSEQVVIFVHLLGLDTNGHAFKPHSKEYLENVEFVDAGIREAVEKIEEFYGKDGKTAFIFTADHGMSDAGTHGDGDPDNTRTPFVAWGAGISEPQPVNLGLKDDHDEVSAPWKLSHLRRRDINQADITPFMASLVGIPVPVNSEGVLPIKYFSTSQEHRSRALLDNVKQIAASYSRKEELKASTEPYFVPAKVSAGMVQDQIKEIEASIAKKDYAEAQRHSFRLIKDALNGLGYLHKYDSALLKTICSLGYAGWILYSLIFILSNYSASTGHGCHSQQISSVFVVLSAALAGWLMMKHSPLQYYLYSAFALGFWHQVAQSHQVLLSIVMYPFQNPRKIPYILGYLTGLEMLVLTFFQRHVLAGINAGMAVLTVVRFGRQKPILTTLWCLSCLSMAAFPLFLPPIKLANDNLYLAGVAAVLLVSISAFAHLRHQQSNKPIGFFARLLLIAMAAALAKNTDALLQEKLGLPIWNQNSAWILLCYSLFAPIVVSKRPGNQGQAYMLRLLDLFMTLAPAYILLSISYEPLFYACFGVQLALWISLESGHQTSQWLEMEHLWIAFGFLFFVNMAFFGTGNMASVSSFTLESVYRFITVFSPFSMAALLILKLLLPFFLLSAAFGVLAKRSGVPPVSLVLLVVSTTDIMTLNFFYLVRDHGSWLEIGTSISHFVIASGLIVFTLVLFGLSSFLLTGVQYHSAAQQIKTKSS